jgi:hypothetical protein
LSLVQASHPLFHSHDLIGSVFFVAFDAGNAFKLPCKMVCTMRMSAAAVKLVFDLPWKIL